MPRRTRLTALVLVLLVPLSACTSGDGGDEDAGGAASGSETSAETLTILDPYTGGAAAGFDALLRRFREEHPDIEVRRRGVPDLQRTLIDAVEADEPPDIAVHPSPGLIRDFVRAGDAVETGVDLSSMSDALVADADVLGTFDGALYGVPLRIGLRSLVWYSPQAFEDAGYEVPSTYDELLTLTQRIAEDLGDESGRAPWCVGLEAGPASGWPATDWVEDAVLRVAGPEAYDAWIEHEVLFASEEVETAVREQVEPIWFGEGAVVGGREAIVETPFSEAPLGLFESPPSCLLHRQAGFISSFFPEGARFGENIGLFLVPPGGDGEVPAIVSTDLAVRYTDAENADVFLEFALSEAGQRAWLEESSFISPRTGLGADVYTDPAIAEQAELLATADVVRIDGSELMPGDVGARAFPQKMLDWVEGEELPASLEAIDAAWPEGLGGGGAEQATPDSDGDAPSPTPTPSG